MSAFVDTDRLERELTLRSLDGRTLARLADVSEATISHLRAGRRVRPATLRRIAIVLVNTPVRPGIAMILPD